LNGKDNLSNVAYKKANWVRYVLGGVLVALLAVVGAIFFRTYENVKDIEKKYDKLTVVDDGKRLVGGEEEKDNDNESDMDEEDNKTEEKTNDGASKKASTN